MPKDTERRKKIIAAGLGAAVVLAAVYGFFSYHRTVRNLKAGLSAANAELVEVKASSEANFNELSDTIASLKDTDAYLSDTLLSEKEKGDLVAEQIGAVSTSIGDLEKLSHTDPELLKKYSKVYFLNEHYVPLSLAKIDPKYVYDPARVLEIHASVWPHMQAMLEAAATDGVAIKFDSAYRSFGTQAVLKSTYRFTYGAGTANSFSAEQGYSEHQLGTAVDFTAPSIHGALAGFQKTPEYAWLVANAYRYGFVLSYPPNNAYYTYEPWHWRYVGIDLATALHAKNQYFYDMDQREINTYLGDIFD